MLRGLKTGDVLPVAGAGRGLIVDGDLGDKAEGDLDSNQPLLDGREATELFRVSVLAYDVRRAESLRASLAMVHPHPAHPVAGKPLHAMSDTATGHRRAPPSLRHSRQAPLLQLADSNPPTTLKTRLHPFQLFPLPLILLTIRDGRHETRRRHLTPFARQIPKNPVQFPGAMAEAALAIGLAASIVAIVQAADRIAAVCRFYIQSTEDCPRDIRLILVETATVKATFESLEFFRNHDPESSGFLTGLGSADGPIAGCLRSITELEGLLPSNTQRGSEISKRQAGRVVLASLAWAFKKEKARELLNQIVQQKTSINLAFSAEAWYVAYWIECLDIIIVAHIYGRRDLKGLRRDLSTVVASLSGRYTVISIVITSFTDKIDTDVVSGLFRRGEE